VKERDGVEIRIGDTGCGIQEQSLKKIFEPFYTTRDKGTGLGLAVVSRIMEVYGGSIHMQSQPDQGTICTIWFPDRINHTIENQAIF
jgi:signal transduction histidine kinase